MKVNPYQRVTSFAQTKPLSPGSESQKHAARGRNRVRGKQDSDYRNRPTALCGPTSNFTPRRITSQTWNSGRNTRSKCGYCGGGGDEDDDGTREQGTRPGRTAALGRGTTSWTTTQDIPQSQTAPPTPPPPPPTCPAPHLRPQLIGVQARLRFSRCVPGGPGVSRWSASSTYRTVATRKGAARFYVSYKRRYFLRRNRTVSQSQKSSHPGCSSGLSRQRAL